MNTSLTLNRWLVGTALAALVAIVLVACGGGGSETASTAEMRLASSSAAKIVTSVTWSPQSITQAMKPGETKSATIMLTAMKSTPSALLRVVPEIAPFVTVTPTSIGPLTAGQSVQVTLAFAAKVDALPLSAIGTVQLRTADASGNALAQPLPVVVSIEWMKNTSSAGGFAFSYSTFGLSGDILTETDPSGVYFNTIQVRDPTSGELNPQYAVNILPTLGGRELLQWFADTVDVTGSLLASNQITKKTLANGIQVLELTGPIPATHLEASGPVPDIFAAIPGGNQVIVIQTLQGNTMAALGVSEAARWQIYEAILASYRH